MAVSQELRRDLAAAHHEAQRVGDSPVKADRVADGLQKVVRRLESEEIGDELRSRLRAAVADAERVLRRDDDGPEAARHLQTAMRLADDRPRAASPFEF